MQELPAVRVLNFSLRACASWPFWTAKPGGLEEGVLIGAGELLEVVDMGASAEEGVVGSGEGEGDGAGDASLPETEPEGTPGDDTRSSSCVPSAIGDRKSTRLNSSHSTLSRMPSSA